jgi:hypothetical protein
MNVRPYGRASHIQEDSPQIILYMTKSMMFVSARQIRFSNLKDEATAGIGRCIKRKSKSVKHVS